jgi:hypothetical protein
MNQIQNMFRSLEAWDFDPPEADLLFGAWNLLKSRTPLYLDTQ